MVLHSDRLWQNSSHPLLLGPADLDFFLQNLDHRKSDVVTILSKYIRETFGKIVAILYFGASRPGLFSAKPWSSKSDVATILSKYIRETFGKIVAIPIFLNPFQIKSSQEIFYSIRKGHTDQHYKK